MSSKNRHKPSLSTTTLIVLVIVTSFTALYMKGLNSGIPYYYDSIGYSAATGGTLVAVFVMSSTVMRLVGGQLTDHFNHYRVLFISLAIMFIGVAIPCAFDNFYVAMGSRVLQGASFAVATNVMTVAVMGSSTKKHIGRRLGINGAGTSLGTMFGALVSVGLLDSLGYQAFYGFYALLVVVAIIAVLLLKRTRAKANQTSLDGASPEAAAKAVAAKSAKAEGTSRTVATAAEDIKDAGKDDAKGAAAGDDAKGATSDKTVKDVTDKAAKPDATDKASKPSWIRAFIAPFLIPQAFPFMLISFARRIPKGFCVAFILIFAKYADIAMGAAFFVVVGITTLLCRVAGGKVFDSDRTWLLLPLQSVQIIGFIAFAVAPNFITMIVAAIGYGISVGTTSPLVKALMAKSTPKEHWGAVNGELFFFADIGKALSAFCGGFIIDAVTKAYIPEIALGTAILSSVITAIALLIGRHVWKRPTP